MPQLPTYQRQVALPNVQMDPRAFAASGEALARGGLVVANVAGDAAARFEEARRAQRLVGFQAQMTREMNDLRLQFDKDTDWTTMPDRFEAQSGQIFKQYQQQLQDDPVVLQMLQKDYLRTHERERVEVQRLARGRQVEAGKADLETALDTYAQVLAGNPDAFVQAEVTGRARAAIQGMAASGLIGMDEAQKREATFVGRVREQKAQALIATDPEKALNRLLDPADKDFGEMDPLARERAQRAAQGRVDQLGRSRTVEAEKAERLAERRLREGQEKVGDDAFTLLRDGKLTREWLDNRRRDLSSSDYRVLLREMSADRATADDPDAVMDLTRQLDKLDPEEFERAASKAVAGGRLKTETYQSLTDRNRNYTRDDRPAAPFRAGRELVNTTLDPGQVFQGAAAGIGRSAQAQALVEFDTWAEANPKAARAETLAEAQNIIRRYQVVRFDQLSLAIGVPRFFQGTRDAVSAEGLDVAERRTIEALDGGALSPAQADQEVRKIEGWRAILNSRAAKSPAPGARK